MANGQPDIEGNISEAWPPFTQKLATVLGKLEEDQYLILLVKRSNRLIQFFAQGSYGMRIETTSNSYLDKHEQLDEQQSAALIKAGWHAPTGTPESSTPENDPDGSPNFFVDIPTPVSFENAANLAASTLANILQVPYPGFLEYEAYDENREAIALPELGMKQAERMPQEGSKGDVALQLLLTLRGLTGISDLDFDENGCISIQSNSVLVFVAVFDNQTCIRVWAPILTELEETPDILASLSKINTNTFLMNLFFRDGTIYSVTDISAEPFVAEHIAHAIGRICSTAGEISKRLHDEFGGRVECVG